MERIINAAVQATRERMQVDVLRSAYNDHQRHCKIASFLVNVTSEVHDKHQTGQSRTAFHDARNLLKYHFHIMTQLGVKLAEVDTKWRLTSKELTELKALEKQCEDEVAVDKPSSPSSNIGLVGIIKQSSKN